MSDFLEKTPRTQIIEIMKRIYKQGLTTLSGGNISIFDAEDNFWITPTAVDKGNLIPADIVFFNSKGEFSGNYQPSSEYPFHWAIYKNRKDIRAIVHTHAPALIAYSIAGKIPDQRISPVSLDVCGEIGFAPYASPGSQRLGEVIAKVFRDGHNVVMLENHGVVAGGPDLLTAFKRMETLEFCARTAILGIPMGELKRIDEKKILPAWRKPQTMPFFSQKIQSDPYIEERNNLLNMVRRAYEHHLMFSTSGSASLRLSEQEYLITPSDRDRFFMQPEDLIYINGQSQEPGKTPTRLLPLHMEIYRQHKEVNAIIMSQAPHITAFAITKTHVDTRSIPESYMLLREVHHASLEDAIFNPEMVAAKISKQNPVALIENLGIVVTGQDLLKAYDRLEVSEFSARSLIEANTLGGLIPIDDEEVARLNWL